MEADTAGIEYLKEKYKLDLYQGIDAAQQAISHLRGLEISPHIVDIESGLKDVKEDFEELMKHKKIETLKTDEELLDMQQDHEYNRFSNNGH